jgi:hypothetical protein
MPFSFLKLKSIGVNAMNEKELSELEDFTERYQIEIVFKWLSEELEEMKKSKHLNIMVIKDMVKRVELESRRLSDLFLELHYTLKIMDKLNSDDWIPCKKN